MIPQRTLCCFAVPAVALALLPAVTPFAKLEASDESAEATAVDLGRSIRERLEKLDSLRTQYRRAREEHTQAIASVDRQIDRLQKSLATATERKDALEEKAAAKQETIRQGIEIRQTLEGVLNRLRDSGLRIVTALEARGSLAVPVRRESREGALALVRSRLDTADAIDHARGLAALFQLLSQELQLSRSREVESRPVAVSPEAERHAFVIRLGLVGAFYASEGGGHVGRLTSDGVEELGATGTLGEGVLGALEILQKRRMPVHVLLPFEDATSSEGGER